MKRVTIFLFTWLCITMIFSSCAGVASSDVTNPDKTISIVCTTYPLYEWTRQIVGTDTDHLSVTLLQGNGADLHSFQPTVDDFIRITDCTLFIYVGGESDRWADSALAEMVNPQATTLSLLAALGETARTEVIVEGMEAETDEVESAELDEHIWLSLTNAQICCAAIADALIKLHPACADAYAANLSAYTQQLSALDERYRTMVSTAANKTMLFGDRFPFRYLADDYGLDYYAAFPGCSAETEASFNTVLFLAEKMEVLGLHTILATESADQALAKTVINTTVNRNQQILVMNSMQSTTGINGENESSYLAIMEYNLDILTEALQ